MKLEVECRSSKTSSQIKKKKYPVFLYIMFLSRLNTIISWTGVFILGRPKEIALGALFEKSKLMTSQKITKFFKKLMEMYIVKLLCMDFKLLHQNKLIFQFHFP